MKISDFLANKELMEKVREKAKTKAASQSTDMEVITHIPTWGEAKEVADDFVSEGATIKIESEGDGHYSVLADFSRAAG